MMDRETQIKLMVEAQERHRETFQRLLKIPGFKEALRGKTQEAKKIAEENGIEIELLKLTNDEMLYEPNNNDDIS